MKWGDKLKADGVITSPEIVEVFNEVNRADFLPDEHKHLAGQDRPITIGFSQTNSAPLVVGQMLQWLRPRPGHKILDIGAGSGWTSALLAHIVGKSGSVDATERIKGLVEFARSNVSKYRFDNLEIRQAGAQLGWPKGGPYDRILVSAATDEGLVDDLLSQLADDGVLVVPVSEEAGEAWAGQTIKIFTKKQGKVSLQDHPGYIFVPLITKSP